MSERSPLDQSIQEARQKYHGGAADFTQTRGGHAADPGPASAGAQLSGVAQAPRKAAENRISKCRNR
jgi:hypothetical protein